MGVYGVPPTRSIAERRMRTMMLHPPPSFLKGQIAMRSAVSLRRALFVRGARHRSASGMLRHSAR